MRLLNGNIIASNTNEVKLVKETFVVRAAKPALLLLVLSVMFNVMLIVATTAYNDYVKASAELANRSVAALEASNRANLALKDQLATTSAAYKAVQVKYEKALVPEATVTEAMQNCTLQTVSLHLHVI